ncbi:MAG: MFS transporter [Chloroflexi bacterium]|nr:MFS transporter [Chloroflexota bacterium]
MDQKWWVLLAVGVGTFMSALDASVANIVLPVVSKDFGVGVATIEWVVTIYLLVVSGLLISFGRLGDLRGHKSVYIFGFLIFIAGSILCGIAPNELGLIAFRALQGIGAAMLFSNSPAILTQNFPPSQRGQALGLQATMTYLGLTVGPSFGGWLTTQFTWRAVFYINVPIGLLAVLLSQRMIPQDKPSNNAEPFDLVGAVLFMIGLIVLMLGLNQGYEWGWTSPIILSLLCIAVIVLGIFVAIESRIPHPMLDLTLFQRRLFSASTGSAVLNYIALYSVIFLMPFYLIQGRGLNAAQAGLLLTAQPLVMAIAAPISGTLSDRIGARLLGTMGMAIMALGLFLLSRLGASSPQSDVALALAVVGLGTGIFISPNNSALMGSAPKNRQGIAAGVLASARNVGMVLGVGLAGAIFSTVLAQLGNAPDALFSAVDAGFFAGSIVALLGAVTSIVRGSGQV